ncbi:MAG: DUF1016 N-terminal domain-containing protein [Chitinispirillales bacterium]|nr:DUF1016 N-terminal domain-containing protein [Chitinispirillales bacterium]
MFRGYTTTNLKHMRRFYLLFKNGRTQYDQSPWSHYRLIMKVENENARHSLN